jgi:hypothetical protein
LVLAVVAVVGIVVALNDKGKPSLAGEASPDLHPGSDIVFVQGTWVYDSAHEGWNEVHPIKDCRRIGRATYLKNDVVDWDAVIANFMVSKGKWRFDSPDVKTRKLLKDSGPPTADDWRGWVRSECERTAEAGAPLTIENQGKPENQWETHPTIDGCAPRNPPDPPGPH